MNVQLPWGLRGTGWKGLTLPTDGGTENCLQQNNHVGGARQRARAHGCINTKAFGRATASFFFA